MIVLGSEVDENGECIDGVVLVRVMKRYNWQVGMVKVLMVWVASLVTRYNQLCSYCLLAENVQRL